MEPESNGTGQATRLRRLDWVGERVYVGTRSELVAAEVVPPGALFPGDIPGKRGGRFTLPDGRRVSIKKHGNGAFWVQVPWAKG